MKILVVGGGGREHAIIQKLKENKSVEKIYALPGNGGIAADAECHPIKANDIEGIAAFAAAHPIDFAVKFVRFHRLFRIFHEEIGIFNLSIRRHGNVRALLQQFI